MSKYSGKCDFRDALEINFNDNWEDFKERATVYHCLNSKGENKKLEFNSPADLIPWYTYIIGSMSYEKDGPCTIFLSKNNYLDEQINSFKKYNLDTTWLETKKQELKDWYIIESKKPVLEQKII